jgi:hypothetical protein
MSTRVIAGYFGGRGKECDNNNYYDNIDFDSLTEMKKRVYEVEGHDHLDV